MILSLGGAVLMFGGLGVLSYLEVPKDVSLTYSLGVAVLFLPVLLFSMLPPRLSADDWLRLDAEGLTRARRGKKQHWRWAEVSVFRLQARLHPAGLVLGQSISFRVPDDHRQSRLVSLLSRLLFLGRNAAIGNNYLSRSRNMVRALNQYRDWALGHAPAPARRAGARGTRSFAPEGPAVFRNREKLRPEGKVRRVLGLGVFLVLGVLLASAIWFVSKEGWPVSVEDLAESPVVLSGLAGGGLAALFTVLQMLGMEASSQNLVLLSSAGLQLRRNGQRQHWFWHEMTEPELRQAQTSVLAGGSATTVGFFASHDGKRPGKVRGGRPLPASIAHAIEDVYDTPPEEIARQMRAWWNAARELGPEIEHPTAVPLSQILPNEGEATSFRRRWAPATSALLSAGMTAMLLVMSAGLVVLHWSTNAELPRPVTLSLVIAVIVLSIAAPWVAVLLVVWGKANNLRLDREGFAYMRLGRVTRWAWRDLSAFEVRRGSLRWGRKQVALVTFAVPRDDRLSRFLRWAYALGGSRAVSVIEDVYDAPPEEIARQLNEYRERVLRARPRRSDAEDRGQTERVPRPSAVLPGLHRR
jgi:hypothetical protein